MQQRTGIAKQAVVVKGRGCDGVGRRATWRTNQSELTTTNNTFAQRTRIVFSIHHHNEMLNIRLSITGKLVLNP
jgi:hypothetical protein